MRFTLKSMLVISLACAFLGACGDDEPDKSNNDNNVNNVNNENNLNNTNNVNNLTIDADVVETEPNDTDEEANSFTVGQSFGGVISPGTVEEFDVDVFSVTLEAGTLLELSIEHADSLDPIVQVLGDDLPGRLLQASTSTSRQFFIPEDGEYTVVVLDARAEEEPHGAEDAVYVVTTRAVSPAPQALTIPGSESGDLSGGMVDVYSFTPAEDTAVEAETTAVRAPIESGLDTILMVWSSADGLVAFNDDIDFASGNSDSQAIFRGEEGAEYWIVVDAYANAADGSYSLEAGFTDDAFQAPNVLELDSPFAGVIGEKDGDEFDSDFFTVELAPGDWVRVELEATGDDLQPTFAVYFPSSLGLSLIAIANPVEGAAAAEFTHGGDESSEYFVIVDDLRNVPEDPDEDPAGVGGDTFDYEIEATATTWTPEAASFPYTTAGEIDTLGTFDWFEFSSTPGHFVGAWVTSTEAAFDPVTSVINSAGVDEALNPGGGWVTQQNTLQIGVRDANFRGAAAGYTYTPSFVSVDVDSLTYDEISEVEPNDEPGTAQEITTLPSSIGGTLDGSPADLGADSFKVSMTAGEGLGAYTLAGSDATAEEADTIITVIAPDGTTEILENDDAFESPDMSFFSAVYFVAEEDGDYTLVVTPFCGDADPCGGNGDYTLRVFKP